MENDFYYDIIYRLKGKKDKNTIKGLNKEKLETHLIQLKRLSASFNGDIIFGIEKLDYIKIIEKNYKYKKEGQYYYEEDFGDKDTNITKIKDIPCGNLFVNEENNKTNELLYDFGIYGEDYKKMGKVTFENGVLGVNTYDFKLDKDKKIYELFDVLFRSKVYYNNMSFTYDELKEVYKSNNKYKELKSYDFIENSINNIILKKMNTIKIKTGMNKNILENKNGIISIWQEKA